MKESIKEKILNQSNSYTYYKEQYRLLNSQINNQKQQIESLNNENQNQKQQIERLNSEKQRQSSEIDSLNTKIKALEKDLDNPGNSNSYHYLKKLLYSDVFLPKYYNLFKESLNEIEDPTHEEKSCPVCGNDSLMFLPVNNRKNALCYNCGSFERQRLIYIYLNKYTDVFSANNSFLHFAPEICLYDKLNLSHNINYVTADVQKNKYVSQIIDMCNIPFEDNTFDYIMANHVLEHVPDDIKAMKELYRTIKPNNDNNARVILSVPLFRRYKETLEKEEYNTDELRLKYYGQVDHVRAYGLDFPKRLESVGFEVKEYSINDICTKNEIKKYALSPGDVIFECKKRI